MFVYKVDESCGIVIYILILSVLLEQIVEIKVFKNNTLFVGLDGLLEREKYWFMLIIHV